MQVTFYGAAREVTGSLFVLATDSDRILLDCGLFQGKRRESTEKNKVMPIDPGLLSNVVLSHAHIDHSGRLPLLSKNGFNGRIVSTRATAAACGYLLPDSAHIQESDAAYLNYKMVRSALAQKLKPKRAKAVIARNTTCTFYEAGHILGSAMSLIKVRENGQNYRVLYTGDIGRFDAPILKNPCLNFAQQDRDIDLLILESTYGNKVHDPTGDLKHRLKTVIADTFKRGGTVLIPAFAFGRTQTVLYILHEIYKEGDVLPASVYVDSPLATNLTRVFVEHPEVYDEEAHDTFLEKGLNPFQFKQLHY